MAGEGDISASDPAPAGGVALGEGFKHNRPLAREGGSWKFSLHSKICLAGAVSTAAEHAGEKFREHQRIQGESQPAQEDRQRL